MSDKNKSLEGEAPAVLVHRYRETEEQTATAGFSESVTVRYERVIEILEGERVPKNAEIVDIETPLHGWKPVKE